MNIVAQTKLSFFWGTEAVRYLSMQRKGVGPPFCMEVMSNVPELHAHF